MPRSKSVFRDVMLLDLYPQDLTGSAYSFVKGCNTLSAKTRAFVVLDDCFLTSRTLLSARVTNVRRSGGCRFRPKAKLISDVSFRGQLHDLLTHPDSGLLFSCVSPLWLLCRFQGCNINAWSGSLGTAFSVGASFCARIVSCVFFFFFSSLQYLRFVFVRGSGKVSVCTLSFV